MLPVKYEINLAIPNEISTEGAKLNWGNGLIGEAHYLLTFTNLAYINIFSFEVEFLNLQP